MCEEVIMLLVRRPKPDVLMRQVRTRDSNHRDTILKARNDLLLRSKLDRSIVIRSEFVIVKLVLGVSTISLCAIHASRGPLPYLEGMLRDGTIEVWFGMN